MCYGAILTLIFAFVWFALHSRDGGTRIAMETFDGDAQTPWTLLVPFTCYEYSKQDKRS